MEKKYMLSISLEKIEMIKKYIIENNKNYNEMTSKLNKLEGYTQEIKKGNYDIMKKIIELKIEGSIF